MKTLIRLVLIVLVLAVIGAAGFGVYAFLAIRGYLNEKRTPAQMLAFLEPHYVVRKPEGEGPFPAILLFNGCEGLYKDGKMRPVMPHYADIAVAEGVVAIIVDSFTPRGIDTEVAVDDVCTGWVMRGGERAGDVAVSTGYARSLPFVDPARLALGGWSHGGWAIMDAEAMPLWDRVPYSLTEWPEDPFGGVAGIYLTYPYCSFPALAPSVGFADPVPTWSIHGSADQTAKPVPCDEAFAHVAAQGAPVSVEVVQGATHAFDRTDIVEYSPSKYSPVAAEIADQRFRRFLREILLADR